MTWTKAMPQPYVDRVITVPTSSAAFPQCAQKQSSRCTLGCVTCTTQTLARICRNAKQCWPNLQIRHLLFRGDKLLAFQAAYVQLMPSALKKTCLSYENLKSTKKTGNRGCVSKKTFICSWFLSFRMPILAIICLAITGAGDVREVGIHP